MSFINFNNKENTAETVYSAEVIKLALLESETKSQIKADKLVKGILEPVTLNEALELFTNKLKAVNSLTNALAIQAETLLETFKAELDLNEGTMSEIHMLADNAKDVDDFINKFFKEFGAKIKKSKDSTEWAESLYTDMTAESVIIEKDDSATHLDALADLVGNAKSFMAVGKELKAGNYKYDFSTGMMPIYTIEADGFKFAILNKKYVDGGDREVGDIAIGLMEAYDGNMVDFKYEFPMRFEEVTSNSPKAIKRISKKGKNQYQVNTSTYMSEPEMKLVADAMGMALVSYKDGGNVKVSVFEALDVNEAKFFRLPAKLNAMWELKNSVDYIVGKHDNGDDYKPEEMKTIEEFIKKIKQSAKAFKSAEEVEGTVYEASVVMDAMDPKAKSLKKLLKKYNVTMKVINKSGPGGGWPEVEMTGSVKDLTAVLADPTGWDDADLAEYIEESVITEKYNKKSLLKKLGGADDARIQTGNGKEYIIYNPDSNNDDNAAMWHDKSVFALDQDGEEHEIDYKDIGLVMVESVITEARFVKDFDEAVLKATTKEEILEVYPNAKFFVGKLTHFFGELDNNLFFRANYAGKNDGSFKVKSVYSKKGSNYVHLFNELGESVVTEAKIKVTKKEWPYVEFKDGGKKHKVEFDYEDIIDDHGNEGQDQYWLGKDDDGQEWMIDVYASSNGDVEEVHYDTIVKESVVTEIHEARSINKISKDLEKTVISMKNTVDEWKIAEGDRKAELLETLRSLNNKKAELTGELDSAVAGKDRNVELALSESDTDDPTDVYEVKPCELEKTPWAVWEGDVRVKCFETEEEAQTFADNENKKEGLEVTERYRGQSDDALLLIQQALKGMKNMKAEIKGDTLIISNKAKDEFIYSLNDGGDVQEFIATIEESKEITLDSLVEKFALVNESVVTEDLRSDVKKFIKENSKDLNILADNEEWDTLYQKLYNEFEVEADSTKGKDLLKTFQLTF